jgi:N-acetylmuramic acid 6-phosphate etherase
MDDRGRLLTEQRNPRSFHLDQLSTVDAFDLINAEDAGIAGAVSAARADVCAAIELVVRAIRRGGRLIYVGAGTSGRLGVLDAVECPPTFLTEPDLVQGIIAGGREAMFRSVEGAEDRAEDGASSVDERGVSRNDVVFGIAAGGTTPFVHGAVHRARELGASTVFLACVPKEQAADEADVSIRVLTGPEVLTGSTRMKAGTATKLVLNMVTTLAMVQLGKVHQNLMVDVNTRSNRKLVDRGIRMLQTITGRSREECRTLLEQADGHVKTAVVMHIRGVDCPTAEHYLRESEGRIRLNGLRPLTEWSRAT